MFLCSGKKMKSTCDGKRYKALRTIKTRISGAKINQLAVADPGFPPRKARNFTLGGASTHNLPNFAKDYMNLKEFGPRGACPLHPLLDLPLARDYVKSCSGGGRG